MHHLDSNKIPGEIVRWELSKNAKCCFEQTMEELSQNKPMYAHLPLIAQSIQVRHERYPGH